MIKLVASDLDGTLVNTYQQFLSEETIDTLKKLHEKGILFVAASGRQYSNMRRLFEPLGFDIPYISENGSLCIYKDEILSTGSIPRDILDCILDGLDEYEQTYHMRNCIFSVKDGYLTDSREEAFIQAVRERNNEIIQVDSLRDVKETVLKAAVFDFNGTDILAPFFQERVGDKIRAATSATHWLDFISPNANKGSALESLMERFGIQKDECICFGDQSNDVEMLHCAGTSYAMESSIPEVKAQADHVVANVLSVLKELL